jgi:hypothetical protein
MNTSKSSDTPVYSITVRKTLMIVFAALCFAGFVPVLLQYKGLIDVESIGIPENYFYIGGFAAALGGMIPIFIVWRCPGCGAYLGREASPTTCRSCGARFN